MFVPATARKLVACVFLAVFLCSAAGCTIRNFERNYVETNSGFTGTHDMAAFVFSHDKDLKGTDFGAGDLFYAVMSGLTLTAWPFPHDGRYAVAPPMWTDFDERIDDELDVKFTERLNTDLGSASINLGGPLTLKELVTKARATGKKYVYVVRYNHYKDIKFQIDRQYKGGDATFSYYENTYVQTHGPTYMLSRMLIDTENSRIILDRERLAECYHYFPIFFNGWNQGLIGNFTAKRTAVKNYIDDVTAYTEESALARSVNHLVQCDFKKGCRY